MLAKRIVSGLLGAALVTVVGCSSGPEPKPVNTAPDTSSTGSAFEFMQEKANAITEAGGLAAVGIARSKSVATAKTRAIAQGRTEIARALDTKIKSLLKDFTEEIGEASESEYNSLFSSATKQVTSQNLKGSVAKDIKFDTKDGVTTGYALMVLDPKVLADAFEAQVNTNRQQYTRFRASKAFGELDKEVKEYEEWQKKDALPTGE